MTKDKPHLRWPSGNDRDVVAEMLSDRQSEQWHGCYEFIVKVVHKNAKNISQDALEDIAHEAFEKVMTHLHDFEFGCLLTTWIFRIVNSCIVNEYRRATRYVKYTRSLEAIEQIEALIIHVSAPSDNTFEVKEDLQQAVKAIQEFVSLHKSPERNRKILQMVLFNGTSLEAAAKDVGCSSAVAGYVVRTAKAYIREQLEDD